LFLAFGFDEVAQAFAVAHVESLGDAQHYSDDADAFGECVEEPVRREWGSLAEFACEDLLDLRPP
jgi:hypothetical protein